MKIQIVRVGKATALTKGPPWGDGYELMSDGIHCNPITHSFYTLTTNYPVMPWECLGGF